MRKTIAMVAAGALALTVATGPATAGKHARAKVNVTLEVTSDNGQPAPDFFAGTVKSKRPSGRSAARWA